MTPVFLTPPDDYREIYADGKRAFAELVLTLIKEYSSYGNMFSPAEILEKIRQYCERELAPPDYDFEGTVDEIVDYVKQEEGK